MDKEHNDDGHGLLMKRPEEKLRLRNDLIAFRDGVVRYLSGVGAEPARTSIQDGAAPTLMAFCFKVCCLDLLGALPREHVDRWAEYIRLHQRADGQFVDPTIQSSRLGGFEKEYVDWQVTAFACSALHSLGSRPDRMPGFLSSFGDVERTAAWIRGLDWKRSWYESNKVMFILCGLQYEMLLSEEDSRVESLRAVLNAALDELDLLQDERTGYWGPRQGSNVFIGMGGTFHVLIPYYVMGRPIRHTEKIVRTTLRLQTSEGLFRPVGGGACDDLDAVDMLVKLGQVEHVRRPLERTLDALLALQQPDGGFPWYRRGSVFRIPAEVATLGRIGRVCDVGTAYRWGRTWVARRVLYPRGRTQKYSGLDRMAYDPLRSDVWSTWFRTLAIALIVDKLGETASVDFHFKSFPGLGFHRSMGGGL